MALTETGLPAWQDGRVEWDRASSYLLPQASLRAHSPARPSLSLRPPSLRLGGLSETEEEARLPGRVGLPGRAVTPPGPEMLQTLDLSGHPATQRQGLSGACVRVGSLRGQVRWTLPG